MELPLWVAVAEPPDPDPLLTPVTPLDDPCPWPLATAVPLAFPAPLRLLAVPLADPLPADATAAAAAAEAAGPAPDTIADRPATEGPANRDWVIGGIDFSTGGDWPTNARPNGRSLDGSSPSPANTSPISQIRNSPATPLPTHASTRARPPEGSSRTGVWSLASWRPRRSRTWAMG